MLKENIKICKDDVLLITAIMYSLDNNINGNTFDKSFALQFRKYITDAESSLSFLCPELLDLIKLVYHLSVYRLLTETAVNSIYCPHPIADAANDLLGDDELEFKSDVFNFLKLEVFCSEEYFNDEEHVMRRFHLLFVEFLVHLPVKLQEMKGRSEDAAKTAHIYMEQGISRPTNLPLDYENFLECLGLFYRMDKEYSLGKDYFSAEPQHVSLSKFIRSLCSDTPNMFVCNAKVLAGLGCSYAAGVFALVKQNGHNMSLDHFFESIMKYLMSFGTQASFNGPIFQSDAFQKVVNESLKASLSPNELNGIIAYLELIQNLCYESIVKAYFTETKKPWIKVILSAARIRPLPREIRAEMLETTSAMIPVDYISHETITSLWDIFYNSKLIDWGSGDLQVSQGYYIYRITHWR